MAVVLNAKGTSIGSFQIGKQGPIIKNNAGTIEFRNAADSDFINITANNLDVVDDTTPQLGGQLDVNGFDIGDGTLELLKFIETGSAVNEITITNAATGTNPRITASGDNAAVGLDIRSKGASAINFDTASGSNRQVQVKNTASAVNYITLTGSATGNDVTIGAAGTDTNIDIKISPNGSGDIFLDGGTVAGSPTGGNKGSGSINVESFFLDGTQLIATTSSFSTDNFTGDGADTTFTMSQAVSDEDAIIVSISGLVQDGGVDYTVDGTTTLTFTSAPPNTAKILVFHRAVQAAISEVENLVINGAMRTVQRGTSFTGLTATEYTLDRWQWFDNGSTSLVVDITQDSDNPTNSGFANSIKIDVTTAETLGTDERVALRHHLEAQNLQHLLHGESGAETVVLSFRLKSTKTGTMCVRLFSSDAGKQFVREVTISSADTWETKEITFPGDTAGTINDDNGRGLSIEFVFAAGSDRDGSAGDVWETESASVFATANQTNLVDNAANNIFITGVQLELGSVSNNFEHISVADELLRCKRYFERLDLDTGSADAGAFITMAFSSTTSLYRSTLVFSEKRTIPSGSGSNQNTFRVLHEAIATTGTSGTISITNVSKKTADLAITAAGTPFTVGNGGLIAREGTSNTFIDLDAEL